MRLRSIRYKDGRAPLHVLHTPMPHSNEGEPENWRGKIIEASRAIGDSEDRGYKLTGYLVVGLFEDGSSAAGWRLPDWLGPTLAPSYIAEVLRRDGLFDRTAREVFDDMFQWVDG